MIGLHPVSREASIPSISHVLFPHHIRLRDLCLQLYPHCHITVPDCHQLIKWRIVKMRRCGVGSFSMEILAISLFSCHGHFLFAL